MNILNFCPFCNNKLCGKIIHQAKLSCNCEYEFFILINPHAITPQEINYIFKKINVKLLCNIKRVQIKEKESELYGILNFNWDSLDCEKIIKEVNKYIKLRGFS